MSQLFCVDKIVAYLENPKLWKKITNINKGI